MPKYILRGDLAGECPLIKSSRVPIDQVQQREQVNPDDVDEVPVQPADFHRRVILRSEISLPGHDKQPGENSQSHNHVQRVQTSHDEIQGEENLRMLGVRIFSGMPGNGNVIETE